jgi:hypothetical protein
MFLLITVIIWVAVIGLLVWAEGLLPIDPRVVRVIQAVTAIVGALLLIQRVGLA